MEQFIETLRKKRINKPEVEKIATKLLSHPDKIASLLQLAQSEEMPLSWHAWWVFDHTAKLDHTLLVPHLPIIRKALLSTRHEGKTRLILSILLNTQEEETVNVPLLNFCFDNMISPTRSVAVQACCMKMAHRLCQAEPGLLPELQLILENAEPSSLTAATRCCIRKIVKDTKRKG